MGFNLDTEEKKFFVAAFTILLVWFTWGVNYFYKQIANNFMTAYALFSLIYTYIIFHYILHLDGGKLFLAFYLTWLIGDIITIPYIVTTSGVLDVPLQASASPDVFVSKMLPDWISPMLKYYFVYVVVPAIGLLIARWLTGKKDFKTMIKEVF